MVDRRHEDQEPSGQRHVAGEAGALGAERLLGDLHDHVLPFLEQFLDLRFGLSLVALPLLVSPLPLSLHLHFRLSVVVAALELVKVADDVGDVEEAVALEADVDEGRLHAGQHLRDPALVDVADDAPIALALDEDLRQLVVLEDGHTGLVAIGRNDHLFVHWGVNW